MEVFVALLRAINVGGTGKLPMAELRLLCEGAGFQNVATYIQSGNLVFESPLPPARAQARLAEALAKRMGKPHAVLLRTAAELGLALERNPFPKASANRVIVHFLESAPARTSIEGWPIPGPEEMALAGRELFIHYPDGMGRSKLKIPFAKEGTGRNLSTVRKLFEMARERRP